MAGVGLYNKSLVSAMRFVEKTQLVLMGNVPVYY